MPAYRVHRLKNYLRQPFRFAPHVSGAALVKPRDYSPGETVEAPSPYAAYFTMRGQEAPLEPGDLLELDSGELRIFKFVGFEEAHWVVPEPKQDPAGEAAASPVGIQ